MIGKIIRENNGAMSSADFPRLRKILWEGPQGRFTATGKLREPNLTYQANTRPVNILTGCTSLQNVTQLPLTFGLITSYYWPMAKWEWCQSLQEFLESVWFGWSEHRNGEKPKITKETNTKQNTNKTFTCQEGAF